MKQVTKEMRINIECMAYDAIAKWLDRHEPDVCIEYAKERSKLFISPASYMKGAHKAIDVHNCVQDIDR